MNYEAKIKISEELIWKLFPTVNIKRGRANKAANIKGFVYTFNKYADYFGIDTALEVCHFIAQVAHESDEFNAFEEYVSGDAYDTRTDLGNTAAKDGDGRWYKGRGGIQTTGKTNYLIVGRELAKLPFLNAAEKALFANDAIIKKPTLLRDPVWASLSAMIYWVDRDLNSLCQPDNQKVTIRRLMGGKWTNYTCSPIEAITRKVNGGMNGFDDRVKKYTKLRASIK